MDGQDWILLTKVPDLIMRGALIARLGEDGIEAYAPDRDVIVNVGTGPNLSLEGYSALFDGYAVYVDRKSVDRAQEILKEIEIQRFTKTDAVVNHAEKFYFTSIMCMILPFLMHGMSIYHFLNAIRKKQKFSPVKTAFSLFIFFATCLFFPFYFEAGIGFFRSFFP